MSRAEARIDADGDCVRPSPLEAVACAALPGDAISGIVHDLGNLIQVAASALSIISRSCNPEAGSALESVVASAGTSLQRAGMLVQQTMRLARADREGMASIEPVSVAAC